jgi:hypothetical protein
LPFDLLVDAACLGASIPTSIAGISGELLLPTIQWVKDWDGDRPYLQGPELSDAGGARLKQTVEELHLWGSVDAWRTNARTVDSASLGAFLFRCMVAANDIQYSEYLYGRGHPQGVLVDKLYSEIDTWLDDLRSWLEIKTGQDLDPIDPLRTVIVPGDGCQLWTEEGDTTSLPASANHVNVIRYSASLNAASIGELKGAVNLVAKGTTPSAAHTLLRDARAAALRQSRRRALIDAGAAVELTLKVFNAVHTHVRFTKLETLGALVGSTKISRAAHLPANTFKDLVKVRNRAMHYNITPSPAETQVAVQLAQKIVQKLDPIPI